MAQKKDTASAVPEDASQAIKGYLWKKCPACSIAAYIVIALFAAVAATQWLWVPILASWRAPLEVVRISPSVNPGTFDVVVRNDSSQPAVVTGVELEVSRVQPSLETIAGSSSLPVTENFDAVLDPERGSIATLVLPPFQVFANSVERFQMRLGTRPSNRSARIDYRLVLRLRVNADDVVNSQAFDAGVSVQ
jgi:hypothetical protein